MSKRSKKKSQLKRRSEKAARKSAQRARYEGYIKAGNNTKSKRAYRKGKKANTVRSGNHPNGPCGNTGCIKCHGIHFSSFLKHGSPHDMPHWMWMRWDALPKSEQKRAAA